MTPADRPGRRRRPLHPDRADPGARPLRLSGPQHRQCRDAVALGGGRRGRSRHHRRGDAGRERPRPDPAHQAGPARSAHCGHERAIHADDRGEGGPARRLRISAQAVRLAGTSVAWWGGRWRRRRAASPRPPRAARHRRAPAADRPQPGDAGDLPHHRAAHDRRPDGDDQRRIGHRQGARRARAARLRQAPRRAVRRDQHGRDPARADRERAVRP